jgi:hypothetical protein
MAGLNLFDFEFYSRNPVVTQRIIHEGLDSFGHEPELMDKRWTFDMDV